MIGVQNATIVEQIVNREIDSVIVYESDQIIAFADHDPINFGHILIGHIDLRHHSDGSRSHRVLLGMGVDVSCRKQGLGQRLIYAVINFCQEKAEIDWLDLCVLSENFPAKNLYLKAGFNVVGEFKDQYRIDGLSVSETAMTKCVKNYA
ncbi:TPA: GNAT family N-acetyltransferase [Vibrio parahaemolyticus]